MLIVPQKRMQKVFEEGLPPGSSMEIHMTTWINAELLFKSLQRFILFSKAGTDNTGLLILDRHSNHNKNLQLMECAKKNGVIML